MEKINKAQAFANQDKAASYMLAKKTLELNPHHPVIKQMLSKVKEATDGNVDPDVGEYADLLYNIALLNSGFVIEHPTDFTAPLHKLLKVGLGLRKDEPVEEIEVDISSVEEEESVIEEPDVEGEVEVEDTTTSSDSTADVNAKNHNEELWIHFNL